MARPIKNPSKPKSKKKVIKTSSLKIKAIKAFNAWIRKRDNGKPCISCGKFTTLQAGHYYPAGTYSCIRFEENNVHGQCLRCNYFLSGNLTPYRKNLEKKIGTNKLEKLDLLAAQCKRGAFKPDRFFYLEIIEKYK